MKTWRCWACKRRRPLRYLTRDPRDEGWWSCRDREQCNMAGARRAIRGVRNLLGDYGLERRAMWRRTLAQHKHRARNGWPEWYGRAS